MHGINTELLKLVRASAAVHGIADRSKRSSAGFFDLADRNDPEFDTEAVYFELLREIGRKVELRVVIDIIAGSSAGGITGAMLARALSHDLPMGRLRDLWLHNADVTELLAPEARARGWSKLILRPLVWASGAFGLNRIRDREVRSKLSLFVRSRWFKPPLDGMRMAGFMYDAMTAMGQPRRPNASLLPSRQNLDLFVIATDYYGCQQQVLIHDPPIIHEREHRHVFRFNYRQHASGQVESDFDLANAPALAFAARATSSFPGAFPPARITEMDELVEARGAIWPRRRDFIERNFAQYLQTNVDPVSVSFIDGAVLNNRPFLEAITAIRGRPAYREVDRRVVYIDPDPVPPGAPAHYGLPGFFATLRGAWSDIPRAGPVTDELNWVLDFNERARRLREIVERARPQVAELVVKVMRLSPDRPLTDDQICQWRGQANVQVERDAGFAYDGYVRLKLASSRAFVSRLIMDIRGVRPKSPFARAIAEIIDAWAAQAGAVPDGSTTRASNSDAAQGVPPVSRRVKFLLAFDVDYRKRRLHFMIEGQNRLYQMLESARFQGLAAAAVDRLKRKFYETLDVLHQREKSAAFNPLTCNLVEEIFAVGPSPSEAKEIAEYAKAQVARHGSKIDLLIDHLAADIDLDATTTDLDRQLGESLREGWPLEAVREVLVNYLGFPFWDVLTFPVMRWREVGEFNEILVDRISAQDATALRGFDSAQKLSGIAFEHFAAFLSRAYREHDYLLGRLHSIDRLIDIVCNSAGAEALRGIDVVALKQRGFMQILDREEPHLPSSKALIAELRNGIEGLSRGRSPRS
ncbi:MAG TPA: patatin-like protein [Pseudolabrys sp.]